jgi:hypothetical protein
VSENPCKDKWDDMVDALDRWEIAKRRSRLLPVATTPLDKLKDVKPIVITQEKLDEHRKFKKLAEEAYDEYQQSIDDYMACLRKHGWID